MLINLLTLRAFSCALLSLLILFAIVPKHSIAIDPESDEAAVSILKDTWDRKLDSRQMADKILVNSKASGDLTTELVYAYLLAKIKQSDIRKAVSASEALLEMDAEYLAGHRARAWLLLLTRESASALGALRDFDEVNDTLKEADKKSKIENLRVIGRMYGYLEGPGSEKVSDEQMRLALEAILKGASEDESSAFQEAREAVLVKYTEMMVEKKTTDANNLKQAQQEREETLEKLKKKAENLDDESKKLLPKIDEITKEANSEISKVQSKATPLETEMRGIDAEIQSVRYEYNDVILDIRQFEALALSEEDPNLQRHYLDRAERLRFLARRYEGTLSGLYRQARNVSAALEQVQAELLVTEARYNSQLGDVYSALGGIAQEQKRTEGQSKRVAKPARGKTGLSRAMENRANALTTYEEFPIEFEKERLLELLKSRGD